MKALALVFAWSFAAAALILGAAQRPAGAQAIYSQPWPRSASDARVPDYGAFSVDGAASAPCDVISAASVPLAPPGASGVTLRCSVVPFMAPKIYSAVIYACMNDSTGCSQSAPFPFASSGLRCAANGDVVKSWSACSITWSSAAPDPREWRSAGTGTLYSYAAGRLTGVISGRTVPPSVPCDCNIARATAGSLTFCAIAGGPPVEVTQCTRSATQ